MVKRQRKPKPRKPVKIEYPPLTLRKWKPPKQNLPHNPKTWKPPKMKYKYPPQMHTKSRPSSLKQIWHHFSYLGDHTFILSGHFSEAHERFMMKSRGFQCSCSCTVAIAFSKLFKMHLWTSHMIDMILVLGDKLYSKSVSQLDKDHGACVMPSEVVNNFYFRNVRIVMAMFTTEALKGDLRKEVPTHGPPSLLEALDTFFEIFAQGIVWTQTRAAAFWKVDNAFYYFDPHDRTPTGDRWHGDGMHAGRGFAMLMRFGTLDKMVDKFLGNLQCQEVNTNFTLTPVDIRHMKIVQIDCPDNIDKAFEANTVKPTLSDLDMILFGDGKKKKRKKPPPEPEPEPEPPAEVVEEVPPEVLAEEEEMADDYKQQANGEQEFQARPVVPPEQVPRLVPSTESINYFADIRPGLFGILRAGTHQGDPDFSRNPGKQSLTNALAALVTLRIYKARNWISEIVNDILKLSEHIFHNLKKERKGDTNFKIMDFHERPIDIDTSRFAADITEFAAYGQLGSASETVLDLDAALKVLFNMCDTCIILGPLVVAVWQERNLYYMYDPNERDELGLVYRRSSIVQEITPLDNQIPSQEKVIQEISLQGSVRDVSQDGTQNGSGSIKKTVEVKMGRACVTWYKNLKDLVAMYKANIPKLNLFDRFHVANVKINDYVEHPEDWYNFKGIGREKWLLRGTFNQADIRFGKESRNTQCTANACVALAYSKLINVQQWDSGVLDEILTTGDELYTKTVQYLRASERFTDKMLMVAEVYPRFPAMGREIHLKIDDCLINGMLDGAKAAPPLKADCETADIPNLGQGLELFFKENDACVVTTRGLSMAVWKDSSNNYFYFDSHGRGEDGLPSLNGTSCVLRSPCLDTLTRALEANLNPGERDEYNISRVAVQLLDLNDEGLVRPPLNAFTTLDQNSAILRSRLSQWDDAKYKLSAGKQTVANLLVALGMRCILPAVDWTQDTLEEVLDFGNKYYDDSVKDYIARTALAADQTDEDAEKSVNAGGGGGGGGYGYRMAMARRERTFNVDDFEVDSTAGSAFRDFKSSINYTAVRGGTATVSAMNGTDTPNCDYVRFAQVTEVTSRLRGGGPQGGTSTYPTVSFAGSCYLIRSRRTTVSDVLMQRARALRAASVAGSVAAAASTKRLDSIMSKPTVRLRGSSRSSQRGGASDVEGDGDAGKSGSPSPSGNSTNDDEDDDESAGKAESDAIGIENILTEFKLGLNKFQVVYDDITDGVLELEGETPQSTGENTLRQIARRIFEGKGAAAGDYDTDADESDDADEEEDKKRKKRKCKRLLAEVSGQEDLIDQGEGKSIVVESKWCNVVMWKDNGIYYLFDPNPRDEAGVAYGMDEWSQRPPYVPPPEPTVTFSDEGGSEEGSVEEEEEHVGNEEEEEENDAIFGMPKTPSTPTQPPVETPPIHPIEQEIIDMIGGAEEGEQQEEIMSGRPLFVPIVKMGSAYWLNEERNRGRAYVMWFTKLDQMLQHVLDNVRPVNQLDECRVANVRLVCSIADKDLYDPTTGDKSDPYLGDWFRFREMDKYQWILRGTIDQTNMRFPPHNRGRQALANAYIANVFGRFYALREFTPRYVDYILKYGDKLHTATIMEMYKQLKNETKGLNLRGSVLSAQREKLFGNPPRYVMTKFAIGSRMITVNVEEDKVVGDISAKTHPIVLDVERGIEKFFEDNKFGVLTAKDVTVAIFKGAKMYYMFDPYTRDCVGARSTIGTACLTRFMNVKDLAELFLQNLAKESGGGNRFSVDALVLTEEPYVRDQKVVEKMAAVCASHSPELSAYRAICEGKCILSASISCDDDRFQRGAPGATAVPTCVVALAMKLAHRAHTWTKPIVDEIVHIGDELFTASSDLLEYNYNPWKEAMRIEHVVRDFKLGTLRANYQVRSTDQRGVISIKHPKILNLRQGIEQFLEENGGAAIGGVVLTDSLCVALWEEPDTSLIYMFDPNPRGATGMMQSMNGRACVVTFMNAKQAADHFIDNLPHASNKNDAFVIVPLEFVLAQTNDDIEECWNRRRKQHRNKKKKKNSKKDGSCCRSPNNRKKRRPPCPKAQIALAADTSEPDFATYKPMNCFFRCTRWGAQVVDMKQPLCRCKVAERAEELAKKQRRVGEHEDDYQERLSAERKDLRDALEERHRLKKLLEEERIGRNKYFELPEGNSVLRGTRSIASPAFCAASRGKQAITAVVVQIILAKILSLNRWNYKHIDICLDIGDQLYKSCYLTSRGEDIDLPFLERDFNLGNKKIHIDIYEPSIRQPLIIDNLTKAFNRFFLQEGVAMVKVKNDWYSIVQRSAMYYLFDPGDRDCMGVKTSAGKGTAIVIRYPTMEALVFGFLGVIDDGEAVDFQMNTIEVTSMDRPGSQGAFSDDSMQELIANSIAASKNA